MGVDVGGWVTKTWAASSAGSSRMRIWARASATVVVPQHHRLGGHQAAGGVLVVGEQPAQRRGLLGPHRVSSAARSPSARSAEQVDGVVGLHLLQDVRGPVEVQALDERHRLLVGHLLEQVGHLLVVQERHHLLAAGQGQRLEAGDHVGGVEVTELGDLRLLGGAGEVGRHLGPRHHVGGPAAQRSPGGRARRA